MSSTLLRSNTPDYGRRIKWLAIVAAICFAAYSAGWFYVAQQAKPRIETALANLSKSGIVAKCAQSEIKGYPFRFGLFCDWVSIDQPQKGLSFSATNLRSAAQVYDPKHGIVELDGPAQLKLPNLPPLSLNWDLLHASVRIARPIPKQISVESKGLVIAKSQADNLLNADYASGHMRVEGSDVALAGESAGVIINRQITPGRFVPEFAGSFDVLVADGVRLIVSPPETLRSKPISLRDRSLTIRSSQIIFKDDGALNLSGPISVDRQGLINAKLSLGIKEPKKLADALSQIFPKYEYMSPTILAAATLASAQNGKMDLIVTNGTVKLGPFALGEIPPLD